MYILLLFVFLLTGLTGLIVPFHICGNGEDLDALRLSYISMYS
jgi:hypothetical protein